MAARWHNLDTENHIITQKRPRQCISDGGAFVYKDYSGLTRLPEAMPEVKISLQREGTTYSGVISLHSETNISFFNRIKVLDKETGKRILPVHYSDNYVTLMPGDYSTFKISFTTSLPEDRIQVVVDSWTSERIVTTVSYL